MIKIRHVKRKKTGKTGNKKYTSAFLAQKNQPKKFPFFNLFHLLTL